MFSITHGKGFQMTFANGWTVSVQFGFGNYCENKYDETTSTMMGRYSNRARVDCATAEIAAWDQNDNWFVFPNGDKVFGHVTPDDVAKFIDEIANR